MRPLTLSRTFTLSSFSPKSCPLPLPVLRPQMGYVIQEGVLFFHLTAPPIFPNTQQIPLN